MRIKQFLQPCVMLCLAGAMTAAMAQGMLPSCLSLPPAERESARAIGACREVAPIVEVASKGAQTVTPVVVLVPNVVGLSFDEARDRLTGFTVRRSYVASAEPGGKILEQQPAPPARLASGSTIRVVLSDGTLRPAPRVTAAEIDGVRRPPEVPVLPPVVQPPVLQQPAPSVQPPLPADAPVAQSSAEARKLPAAMAAPTPSSAEARKPSAPQVAVSQRSSVVPSKAPVSRARVEAIPAPSAASPARPAPVIETFELPNVIGRSSAEATAALAEFKIERVEIVANAAPSGQVLAQEPKPGTPVRAGSVIGLQVSDGSLASASVTAPAVVQTPAPAPAPVQKPAPVQNRAPVTFPSTAVLLLIAGVLAGLGFGAWWMRRWLAKRHDARMEAEAIVPIDSPAEIDRGVVSTEAVPDTAPLAVALASPVVTAAVAPAVSPRIIFAARLGEGETTIEFAAPSDAEEMALEYSRDLHE